MRYQPQGLTRANPGNPIAAKLSALFAFNGTFRSALPRNGNPVVTAGPTFSLGPAGYYAVGNGAGKVATDLLPSALGMQGAAPRTFIVEFDMPDSSVMANVFSFGDGSTATRSMNALQINAGTFRLVRFDTYANDTNYTPHNVGGTAARVFLAITYDGNVTLTFRSWSYLYSTRAVVFNSQTSTLAGPMATGNTAPLNLMGGGSYSFPPMTSGLYHLSMYGGRVLSDAEIVSVYQNRWQLFDAPDDDDYLAAAAAGGGAATYSYTSSGGIVFSGVASKSRGTVKTPAGGILVAGSGQALRGAVRTPQGGLVFSGASGIVRSIVRAAAGGLKFAGAAALSATAQVQARVITPVGGLLLAGAAVVSRATSRAVSGGITFSGHAVRTAGAAGALLASLLPIFRRRRR